MLQFLGWIASKENFHKVQYHLTLIGSPCLQILLRICHSNFELMTELLAIKGSQYNITLSFIGNIFHVANTHSPREL